MPFLYTLHCFLQNTVKINFCLIRNTAEDLLDYLIRNTAEDLLDYLIRNTAEDF